IYEEPGGPARHGQSRIQVLSAHRLIKKSFSITPQLIGFIALTVSNAVSQVPYVSDPLNFPRRITFFSSNYCGDGTFYRRELFCNLAGSDQCRSRGCSSLFRSLGFRHQLCHGDEGSSSSRLCCSPISRLYSVLVPAIVLSGIVLLIG